MGLASGRCPAPAVCPPRVPGQDALCGPLPLLQAARHAEPPAPGVPSGPVRASLRVGLPAGASPRGAHLPVAPRMGSGSFSGRMGNARGSGPAPRAGREPSNSSPRSNSGAGGAGRLGMTRTGQLGRREGGGSRRGRREVGGGPGRGRYGGRGPGPGPGQCCEGLVGQPESLPSRAGREERPGGARADGR